MDGRGEVERRLHRLHRAAVPRGLVRRETQNGGWLASGPPFLGPRPEPRLPPGYSLDRSDSDVWVLLCPQGATVARFSAQGAAPEAIEREARAHHRAHHRERNQPT
jgi:hypothetical protein